MIAQCKTIPLLLSNFRSKIQNFFLQFGEEKVLLKDFLWPYSKWLLWKCKIFPEGFQSKHKAMNKVEKQLAQKNTLIFDREYIFIQSGSFGDANFFRGFSAKENSYEQTLNSVATSIERHHVYEFLTTSQPFFTKGKVVKKPF